MSRGTELKAWGILNHARKMAEVNMATLQEWWINFDWEGKGIHAVEVLRFLGFDGQPPTWTWVRTKLLEIKLPDDTP